MKTAVKRGFGEYLKLAATHYSIMCVYFMLRLAYRVCYGFRLIGVEHMPTKGPAIIVPSDSQGLGGVLAQVLANIGLLEPFFASENVVGFMHEQLVANVFGRLPIRMRTYGLRPLRAGTQALSLIDAYRQLVRGGIAIIAPEGDMCLDGKTVSVRNGCAWLGLRTAAPLIPLIPTAGCYDIWPFWQAAPKLTGRMSLIVGEPFTLTDHPLDAVHDQDLAAARATIQKHIDGLRFGAGGVSAWEGQPLLHGRPAEHIRVRICQPSTSYRPRARRMARQGMAVLLFQCPMCGTNGSIVHRRRPLRQDTVRCGACEAEWSVRRIPGKDFRLTLVHGPAEIQGLEMALSAWYARVKDELVVCPIEHVSGFALDDGERALLLADDARLITFEANALAATGSEAEPPVTRSSGHLALPANASLGQGRLLMTDRRLVWQREEGNLSFNWASVHAVHLVFRNLLAISYGAAFYMLHLGDESAVRWLACADRVLNGDDRSAPRRVPVSPY